MRPRSRADQVPRVVGAAGLVLIAFLVAGPGLTGATLVTSAQISSAPIHAGTWSSGSAYPAAVVATAPAATDILRLDEQSPVVFVADSGSRGVTAVASGTGLGWGTSGLLVGDVDTALSFDGNAAGQPCVRTGGATTSAPASFTVTAWVDASAGGRILGYGDAASGPSTDEDRVLYVDDAGYLHAAVRDAGGVVTSAVSDAPIVGATHHVAFSLGASGLLLYVDGTLQAASDPGTTTAKAYSGWWRIGWDSLPTDYPGLASADGLVTGTVDEVAIWDAQLSDADIAALAAANHA
jgi:Concanavalin A-like lectin/glucanases superfamily